MKIIDAHCHVGSGFDKKSDPAVLLKKMDENDVQMAFISPIEQYIAVDNEEGNAYVLDLCRAEPTRFVGFATVNPWYMERGVKMLKRYFDKGLKGLKLNPKLQGFSLASRLVDPIIEVAAEYNAPVYFHTGTMIMAEPLQLSALAARFPTVNFIMGHSGNTDFWTDAALAAQAGSNIYLDTSHNLSSSIEGLIKEVGASRVVFSSNEPRSHLRHELDKFFDLDLDADTKQAILYNNAKRLIGG